jgi:hypothetical protein
MSSETTLNGPGFAKITPVLLSPAGTWVVNETNDMHLI